MSRSTKLQPATPAPELRSRREVRLNFLGIPTIKERLDHALTLATLGAAILHGRLEAKDISDEDAALLEALNELTDEVYCVVTRLPKSAGEVFATTDDQRDECERLATGVEQ